MNALKGYVVVENLDKDLTKTEGGIYVQQMSKPHVGHYKVISVSDKDDAEFKVGDTVWALEANVSRSTNFGNPELGIIKYENVMARD